MGGGKRKDESFQLVLDLLVAAPHQPDVDGEDEAGHDEEAVQGAAVAAPPGSFYGRHPSRLKSRKTSFAPF